MDNILGLLFSKLGMLLGLLAVMVASYMVFEANKSNAALSDVATLAQGVQSLYSGSQFTTNLTDATVIGAGIAPPDMIQGTTLVNQWGGAVVVEQSASGSSAQFQIVEAGVPGNGCIKMATGMTYQGLLIDNAQQTMPLDPAQVAQACFQVGNVLVMRFGH